MTQNLYSWANENLSDSRARAFKDALRKIEDSKFSAEWSEARRGCDTIVREHVIARQDEIKSIESQASEQIDALTAQIAVLKSQVLTLENARDEAVMSIRTAGYQTAEYKEQEALASALWNRDDEAVQPQRDALVAKYAKAQAKVSA